jgi:cysteine desulfuration protein SufE
MEVLHLTPIQQEVVSELLALDTPEEKLEFLSERTRLIPPLRNDELTECDKVPGCLSGLWLVGTVTDGVCIFRAHSDSSVVAGVAGLLCDLYSARSAGEIMALPESFSSQLRIEQLLSMNRRQAVRRIVEFMRVFAVSAVSTPDR